MTQALIARDLLRDALEQSAEAAGCSIDIVLLCKSALDVAGGADAWHGTLIVASGAAAQAWIDTLDETSFTVPGFAIAQMDAGTVEPAGAGLLVAIEALTIREA